MFVVGKNTFGPSNFLLLLTSEGHFYIECSRTNRQMHEYYSY